MVYATATPALDAQRLRVYPGNRILALLDKDDPDPLALELACHLARTLAMSSVSGEDPGIDDRLLADRVNNLRRDRIGRLSRGPAPLLLELLPGEARPGRDARARRGVVAAGGSGAQHEGLGVPRGAGTVADSYVGAHE